MGSMLRHLGIIADGNRRWAKARGLPSMEGHKKGLDAIERLVKAAADTDIEYLTFYVFSTENWGRSTEEVSYIMKLAQTHILKYAKKLAGRNARLLVLGSRERISPKLASIIEQAERTTEHCTGITICLCFNYGGEQEIANAAKIALEADGEITTENIRKHLYHPEVPDMDMVVRTSGEERISGFMLWRAAYSEFMFMKKYFPEMEGSDIGVIIEEYNKRNRRFGK